MKKPNFKKFFKAAAKILPFAAIAAVLLSVAFFPKPSPEEEPAEKRIVRIWNVDTFEGGRGSRTAFLKRAAAALERRDKNVYYLVSSYTVEGAEAAFLSGQRPDALSFGIGLSAYAEASLPLPYTFAGGTAEKDCIAYPWCRGGYFLFSLTDDFEEEGSTVISVGGSNLPEACAALEGIKGEPRESLSAYVEFLNGNYRYLLGTQRDICRLTSRGVTFYTKPLFAYNDLYQYYSVLSKEKRGDCLALLDTLLSGEQQDALSNIGMYPVANDRTARTPSVLSDASALADLKEIAGGEDGAKIILKFLKNV